MKLLLDTCNIVSIEKYMHLLPIDGVTTNPTLVAKERSQDVMAMMSEIRETIGEERQLHIQVIDPSAEVMVKEGVNIHRIFGQNTYVKIPVSPQGLSAAIDLKERGIKVTVTAVHSLTQAILAAKIGADYIAPYVNRLERVGVDGALLINEIVASYKAYGYQTKILAASFKNIGQINKVCRQGTTALTVAPDLVDELIHHTLTDVAINQFSVDWKNTLGETATTLDVFPRSI